MCVRVCNKHKIQNIYKHLDISTFFTFHFYLIKGYSGMFASSQKYFFIKPNEISAFPFDKATYITLVNLQNLDFTLSVFSHHIFL